MTRRECSVVVRQRDVSTTHSEALAGVTCGLVTPLRARVGAPDAAALERLVRRVCLLHDFAERSAWWALRIRG